MLGLTFDIDWAPEKVIEDTMELLESYGAKATFFATHNSEVVQNVTSPDFEIGLHPNLNPLLSNKDHRDFKKVISELKDIYPNACGIRSHSLVHSSPILEYCRELGMEYDVNQFLPYMQGIEPYLLYNGLVRIPYHWEDDIHWLYGKSFSNSEIDLRKPGTKILNFHPVHVYLNTPTEEFYYTARPYYQEADKLLALRNQEIPGTRDLLIDTLETIKREGLSTCTMNELAQKSR